MKIKDHLIGFSKQIIHRFIEKPDFRTGTITF